MRKILCALFLAVAILVSPVMAQDWQLLVPQGPAGGTTSWANVVADILDPFIEGDVKVRQFPGAKDIPGFNAFHETERFKDNVIMVSHGGNAIGYLVDDVKYDLTQYEMISLTNLNITNARHVEPIKRDKLRIAGVSGMEADGMAIAMLICGNLPTVDDYLTCWDESVIWINGMPGGERRLSFKRKETDVARESITNWIKHFKDNPEVELWFHHGVFDFATGKHVEDPNHPEGYIFEAVFERMYGEPPTGPFYEAYDLSRTFRDVLQRVLWVDKDNPNKDQIRKAVYDMTHDPVAIKKLEAKNGKYEWIVGSDDFNIMEILTPMITKEKLKTMTIWHEGAYNFPSVYKPDLEK